MFYVYLVLSAVLIPVLDNFFDILRHPYSWWLVPVLFIAFFLGLVILHLAVTCIWIATANVNKPPKGTAAFRKLANITVPLLLKLTRVSVKVTGAEKVDPDKRMLFVCNHQHDFDPVIMLSVFPDSNLGFIGKKDIYKTMPFIAKAMHRLYCLPIDRENDRAAAKTVIEAARILKSGKASIGLFPEGYTSKTCELLPFRNGSFKIAYRAGADITVCAINNTRSIPKRMFLRHTTVELRVLDVIPYEKYKDMATHELGDMIHAEMEAALAEMRSG